MCLRCVLAAVLTLAEDNTPPQPEQQAKKDPGVPVVGYKMQADNQVRRGERVNTAAMDDTAQQADVNNAMCFSGSVTEAARQIRKLQEANAALTEESRLLHERLHAQDKMLDTVHLDLQKARRELRTTKEYASILAADLSARQ